MKNYINNNSECKTSIYLPAELMRYLATLAKRRRVSKSSIIKDALLAHKERGQEE